MRVDIVFYLIIRAISNTISFICYAYEMCCIEYTTYHICSLSKKYKIKIKIKRRRKSRYQNCSDEVYSDSDLI